MAQKKFALRLCCFRLLPRHGRKKFEFMSSMQSFCKTFAPFVNHKRCLLRCAVAEKPLLAGARARVFSPYFMDSYHFCPYFHSSCYFQCETARVYRGGRGNRRVIWGLIRSLFSILIGVIRLAQCSLQHVFSTLGAYSHSSAYILRKGKCSGQLRVAHLPPSPPCPTKFVLFTI